MHINLKFKSVSIVLLVVLFSSFFKPPSSAFAGITLTNRSGWGGNSGYCSSGASITAVGFTTPATGTNNVDTVTARIEGSGAQTLTLALRADATGVPGTVIGSATAPFTSFGDYTFDFNGASYISLATSTTYWLALTTSAGGACDLKWTESGSAPSGTYSYVASRHYWVGSWSTLPFSHFTIEINAFSITPTNTPTHTPTYTPTPTHTPTNTPTTSLLAFATCFIEDLGVNILSGDAPFNIIGTGPGLPVNNVSTGITTIPGPGVWQDVQVVETGGDGQTTTVAPAIACGSTATPTPTDTATYTPSDTPTDMPTNTPTFTPSDTSVPPTSTPIPPSNTPTLTPSNTPVPVTNTATSTPIPPTNTPTASNSPIPVTNTATNTPIPPTFTFTPSLSASPTVTTCAMSVTPPNLISPAHRAHTTDTTPQFTWSNISGAQSYRLMVYLEDRSFEYKKRTFSTTYTLAAGEALARPAKYLWRVRTQDTNCSTWTSWSGRNTLFVD